MQLDSQPRLEVHEVGEYAESPSFAREVRDGLSAADKSLPCRFLYDAHGSMLFEQICELEEYYPTRCEVEILTEHCGEIMGPATTNAVIELGSGSSRKARLLLGATIDRYGAGHYLPIDVSAKALQICGHTLITEFEDLQVSAILGEYEPGLALATKVTDPGRTIFWLGGSVGNFTPAAATRVLRSLCGSLDISDRLVIGIDLRKDAMVLERAYDDSEGITAEFNLNLLHRINKELGGNIDISGFRYVAEYNDDDGGVHMYLESVRDQRITITGLDLEIPFQAGERIHTEDSFKYSLPGIAKLAEETGLHIVDQWLDSGERFSVTAFQLVT